MDAVSLVIVSGLSYTLGSFCTNIRRISSKRPFLVHESGPIQYGSVDGGYIAKPDSFLDDDAEVNTIYTVHTPTMITEIITDEDCTIKEDRTRGNVVMTNWVRRLMPVIRYPMGDVAEWTEYSSRNFRLCGRGMVAFRLGPSSYELTTLKMVVSNVMTSDTLNGFQVIIRRDDGADQMIFRIASQPKNRDRLAKRLEEELGRIKANWTQEVQEGFYKALAVELVSVQDLNIHSRTGKLREIVDLRIK